MFDYGTYFVQMTTDLLQHTSHGKSKCYNICIGICCIQLGCYNLTRYCTYSMYECTQDLGTHIPTCTVVLVLVPMYDPTYDCALKGFT